MIRKDFPLISHPPYAPFCYLDNAATTQVPQQVIDAIEIYLKSQHANIHRSPHRLGEGATELYELLRTRLAQKYSVPAKGVVLTYGATDSLNILAHGMADFLEPESAIVLTELDHHAALVPWLALAQQKNLKILWAPINWAQGTIDLNLLEELFHKESHIKLMTFVGLSHVLGIYQPIEQITALCRKHGIISIVDGCQMGLDALSLDLLAIDYFVISAHKMFGPAGIGAIISSCPDHLKLLQPYRKGGGMILSVKKTGVLYQEIPTLFEAGTPPLVAAAGWIAALAYIEHNDSWGLRVHLEELKAYILEKIAVFLKDCPQYHLVSQESQAQRAMIFSFVHKKIHVHDLATYLDHRHGIAVRAGHHCAMPLMEAMQLSGTLRASFSWYNTKQECDLLLNALKHAQEFFNV